MKTSGHFIGKYLKRRGIDALFGLSGGHVYPIMDGCVENEIRFVDTRHEQAAAFAAEGYALRSGKPGAYTVIAGPGFANAVSGLAHASVTLSPTICLAGDVGVHEEDKGAPQEVEQEGVAAFYANFAKTVRTTDRIPQYLELAFQQMLGSNPGPAYLGLPMNVSWRAVSDEAENMFMPRDVPKAQGNPNDVAKAAEMIKSAKKPAIVVGSGGFWSGAASELKAFAEQTELPIFTRNAARGLLPDEHPQCYGLPGLGVFRADLVVVMGSRMNSGFYYGQFGDDTQIVQVDCNNAAMGNNQEIDLGICGDVGLVLDQLGAELQGFKCDGEWISILDDAKAKRMAKFGSDYHSDMRPVHPLRILHELNEFADEHTTFAIDGGDFAVEAARHLNASQVGAHLSNGSILGSLGPGIPFAIGAKIAAPDDTVICVMGDGAFGLSAMEMDTAIRHNIPIIVVIGNDQCWGMVERSYKEAFGENRTVGAELGDRPYDKMVEALGGYGERVEDPEEIQPALRRAVESKKPACINIVMARQSILSAGEQGG